MQFRPGGVRPGEGGQGETRNCCASSRAASDDAAFQLLRPSLRGRAVRLSAPLPPRRSPGRRRVPEHLPAGLPEAPPVRGGPAGAALVVHHRHAAGHRRHAPRRSASGCQPGAASEGDGETVALRIAAAEPRTRPARSGAGPGTGRNGLRAEVDRLPEFLRQVLLLAYFQGLKYREIADALDIPVGTVKSRPPCRSEPSPGSMGRLRALDA